MQPNPDLTALLALLNKSLADFISGVQEVAPALWLIAKQKVYAQSVENAIQMVILLSLALALFFVGQHSWKESMNDRHSSADQGGYAALAIGGWIIMIVLAIWGMSCAMTAIDYWLANDYNAAMLLKDLILGVKK